MIYCFDLQVYPSVVLLMHFWVQIINVNAHLIQCTNSYFGNIDCWYICYSFHFRFMPWGPSLCYFISQPQLLHFNSQLYISYKIHKFWRNVVFYHILLNVLMLNQLPRVKKIFSLLNLHDLVDDSNFCKNEIWYK